MSSYDLIMVHNICLPTSPYWFPNWVKHDIQKALKWYTKIYDKDEDYFDGVAVDENFDGKICFTKDRFTEVYLEQSNDPLRFARMNYNTVAKWYEDAYGEPIPNERAIEAFYNHSMLRETCCPSAGSEVENPSNAHNGRAIVVVKDLCYEDFSESDFIEYFRTSNDDFFLTPLGKELRKAFAHQCIAAASAEVVIYRRNGGSYDYLNA